MEIALGQGLQERINANLASGCLRVRGGGGSGHMVRACGRQRPRLGGRRLEKDIQPCSRVTLPPSGSFLPQLPPPATTPASPARLPCKTDSEEVLEAGLPACNQRALTEDVPRTRGHKDIA